MARRPTAEEIRKDPYGHGKKHEGSRVKEAWGRVARWITEASGSVWAFGLALLAIVAWALTGPVFGFSDTWQLVINTSTTIVTFLMVFLIQHSQSRDTKALQLKLNEIIAALDGASNRMIRIEDLSEDELKAISDEYQRLVANVPKGDRSPRSVAEVEAPDGPPQDPARAQEKAGRRRIGA
jgi:low affinity Fe/Cu permease